MGYHFLNFKLEDVIKNFIKSQSGPACDVWGFGELASHDEASFLKEPWVGVRCMKSSAGSADVQLDYAAGDRYFEAEVQIRTHAEDSLDSDGKTVLKTARDFHADLASQVLDIFFTPTVKDDLNASAQQSSLGVGIDEIDQPEMNTTMTEARSFITLATFRILCHPTL